MSDLAPVILLAHGSPDPRSAAAGRALADRAAAALGREVEIAFLDHDAPTLEAVCTCAALRGHDRAVVVPLFLSRAFHARVDVPREIADAQEASGVLLHGTPALGCEPSFLDAAVEGLPAGPVVFGTAGTSSASAQDDLRAEAAAFSARTGRPSVVAFASQAAPDPATAIAALEASTGEQAVVASLVLFPGVLPDRIAAAAAGRPVGAPIGGSAAVIAAIGTLVATAAIVTAGASQ